MPGSATPATAATSAQPVRLPHFSLRKEDGPGSALSPPLHFGVAEPASNCFVFLVPPAAMPKTPTRARGSAEERVLGAAVASEEVFRLAPRHSSNRKLEPAMK